MTNCRNLYIQLKPKYQSRLNTKNNTKIRKIKIRFLFSRGMAVLLTSSFMSFTSCQKEKLADNINKPGKLPVVIFLEA